MNFDNKINYKKCCFTGHRPSGLPWGYNEQDFRYLNLKVELIKKIKQAIEDGFNYFISGMALGVDILAAEIVLNLKKEFPFIKLELAIPCLNQFEKWKSSQKERYNKVFKKADFITYVSKENYFTNCMQLRNKYMVNNSNKIIAVFNGKNGGTKQTIDYATEKGVEIEIIKP